MSYGTFEFLMPSNKNGIQRIEQDFLTCIHPDLCTYKINNQHDKYFEQTLQKIKDAKKIVKDMLIIKAKINTIFFTIRERIVF